jgi:hypothetical protein
MSILTRDQILAKDDLKRKKVHVPQWGGDVYVRIMTAAERDSFEQKYFLSEKPDLVGIRAQLAATCIVDEQGNNLFTDADLDQLKKKSAAAVEVVFKAAESLNALSTESVEELEKN